MNNKKLYTGIFRFYELYVIIILIFFDYLSKYYAYKLLASKKIDLLSNFIYFELYKNKGIAFSMNLPFIKIITIIIIGAILYYYIKYERSKNNKFLNISYILIISGALGNARERIFLGEVTDFIGVKFFSVFNLADIYISIGIILYLIIIVLKKDNECV
ncbi:MAG: signal peptidase II [Candidatus Gracilibacteria bacterium]